MRGMKWPRQAACGVCGCFWHENEVFAIDRRDTLMCPDCRESFVVAEAGFAGFPEDVARRLFLDGWRWDELDTEFVRQTSAVRRTARKDHSDGKICAGDRYIDHRFEARAAHGERRYFSVKKLIRRGA